jgi:hypothetical protein
MASRSNWSAVPRITPDERIGKEPIYGAKGTSSSTKPATAQSTGTGTTRGARNNNPGNVSDGAFAQRQPGYVGSDGRFAIFNSPEAGVNAQMALLNSYADRGFDTPAEILNRYAPSSENNTSSYLDFVTSQTGFGANQELSRDQLGTLAQVMGRMEIGTSNMSAFNQFYK